MKRSEAHCSLDGKLRRLLWSMLLLVCVILVATLAILLLHNHQYSIVTANIVRASQFNQNFKEDVDLKMYYYVIDSSYGETLPLQEVGEAKALAQELGPSGIRVNAVAPGVIRTDMCASVDPAVMEDLRQQTPIGRLGTPEDIAQAMLYLADAPFLTGQTLPLNGGFVIT